jgi:hypothetical protein
MTNTSPQRGRSARRDSLSPCCWSGH